MPTISRPSRDGITLFEGDVGEFDGKVTRTGALEIAQYEGRVLCWDYKQSEKEIVLQAERGRHVSDPVLRIPLTEYEVQIIHNHREKGGWGFYDLHVEENDDRAAVNVSLITADKEPTSLLWIIDNKRRSAVREALNSLFDGTTRYSTIDGRFRFRDAPTITILLPSRHGPAGDAPDLLRHPA